MSDAVDGLLRSAAADELPSLPKVRHDRDR